MKPYLQDEVFLKKFDLEEHKIYYVKIIILEFNSERPIAAIEGRATGGTINLSGTSYTRRSGSCSIVIDPRSADSNQYTRITEIQNLLSMNKKVKIEKGFQNTLKNLDYQEHDIIWFPCGTFVIKAANAAKSLNGINISLTLNDKSSLLNGDIGGTIPAATVFSESELYSDTGDTREVEKVLIKDIIKNLVVDFGGEDPSRVLISDIPDSIVKVLKWTGENSLYYKKGTSEDGSTLYDFSEIEIEDYTKEFKYGEDVAYANEPFVYPGTLECNAGETVASVLDKIKNTLGNYEWFYDLYGNFIFQEKKNYLNTSKANEILKLDELSYYNLSNKSKTKYTFDSSNRKLLTNLSVSPQYKDVKNDFIVWGSKKTASGATKPVRYHLAFDTKPPINTTPRVCVVYTDYRGLKQAEVIGYKSDVGNAFFTDMPANESSINKNKYYFLKKDSSTFRKVYKWSEEYQALRECSNKKVYLLTTDDWRTELYFRGLETADKTFAKNYYFAELNSEWPKIYDITKEIDNELDDYFQQASGGYIEMDPSQYEFFLDFIDVGESNINTSQFNVHNIGRRTVIGKDNTANCVFASAPLDLIILAADGDNAEEIAECNRKGQNFTNVSMDIYNQLSLGGSSVSAYDKVKELLYQNTTYNETISLSTIPIFHLEPGVIINISDTDLAINGDYYITTMSLPLAGGTSNISCTKIIEKKI